MEFKFFGEQINILKAAYGEKTYPQACVKEIWDEVKHVKNERFKKAIKRLLAKHVNPRFPPNIEDFEKALSQIQDEEYFKEKEKNKVEANQKYLSADEVSNAINSFINGFGNN